MANMGEMLKNWWQGRPSYVAGAMQKLQLKILQERLGEMRREAKEAGELEKMAGEFVPTYEPRPAEMQPLELTPQEQELQTEVYTPPPGVSVETKPGYRGMTYRDFSAMNKIGLTPLKPTKEKPEGDVIDSALVKSMELPASHYETVKDGAGNIIRTDVYQGGRLVRQYDAAGKEVKLGTLGQPMAISKKPEFTPTDFRVFYESLKAKGHTDEEISKLWEERQIRITSARAEIPQKVPAEQASRIGELETLLQNIDVTESLYEREWVGPISGRVGGIKEKYIGTTTDKQNQFYAYVRDMKDALLRARSGAQINEQEYRRLVSFLPDENLPPSTFESRLKRFREAVNTTLTEKKRALKAGGYRIKGSPVTKKTAMEKTMIEPRKSGETIHDYIKRTRK